MAVASLFHGTKSLAPNRGDTSEPQQLKLDFSEELPVI
jgi:hypothetical protein